MQQQAGFPKVNEGRDEKILEPDLPIVDAHHHLFHRPTLRYLFDDYLEDARLGHNIEGSIYIETQAMARPSGPDIDKPLGEIEFANGVGAVGASGVYGRHKIAAGIVGYADMSLGNNIAAYLAQAQSLAPKRFCGVRQIALSDPDPSVLKFLTHPPAPNLLDSSQFTSALAELGRRNLSFDATVLHTQLATLAKAADTAPDTTIILDHMGLALAANRSPGARAAVFENWRSNMEFLAQRENIFCKIGGLGTSYWGFEFYLNTGKVSTHVDLADVWRPYVEVAIEAFGVERCMMESNFPNDGRSCGFIPLWNALKLITTNYSDSEKEFLYKNTCLNTYKVSL